MNRRQLLARCALLCAVPTALQAAVSLTRCKVTTVGAGPDLVLIPGLGSFAAVWDGTVAKLKTSHRLHVVQVAGFAGLPAGPNATGEILGPIVEELATYIAAETRGAPAVVGHSLGGLIGLLLATRHPNTVRKLMVVDALPFIGLLYGPSMTVDAIRPQAVLLRDSQLAMPREQLVVSLGQAAARLTISPENVRKVEDWSRASDPSVFARATYETFITDVRDALPAVSIPITVVYPGDPGGRADALYRNAYAGAVSTKFLAINGSRHFVMLDQPEIFQSEVDRWWAG